MSKITLIGSRQECLYVISNLIALKFDGKIAVSDYASDDGKGLALIAKMLCNKIGEESYATKFKIERTMRYSIEKRWSEVNESCFYERISRPVRVCIDKRQPDGPFLN